MRQSPEACSRCLSDAPFGEWDREQQSGLVQQTSLQRVLGVLGVACAAAARYRRSFGITKEDAAGL
jgi:hypothetical protein